MKKIAQFGNSELCSAPPSFQSILIESCKPARLSLVFSDGIALYFRAKVLSLEPKFSVEKHAKLKQEGKQRLKENITLSSLMAKAS